MKRIILTLSLFMCWEMLLSQQFDANWICGNANQAQKIQFTNNPPQLEPLISSNLGVVLTSASVSDSMGNLLFYTNGVKVYTHNHTLMENGDSLAPSNYTNNYYNSGLSIPQAAIILPLPNNPHIYYLFHYTWGNNTYNYPEDLLYTVIDISQNNGEGKVIVKNQVVVHDMLIHAGVMACKHGNGKDWWIAIPKAESNKTYTVLLTENGIKATYLRTTTYVNPIYSDGSLLCFSPNGEKYVRCVWPQQKALLYDFDRCNATFSNMKTLNLYTYNTRGAAFSPNSKVMYASAGNYLFQYDLTATDIEASRDTLAIYDGTMSPMATTFGFLQLAPDGKIYIATGDAADKMHIIHAPDSLGTACNVQQNGLSLPYINRGFPHFPNYRLSALAEPCDTTSSVQLAVNSKQVQVYPNPAQGYVQVELPQGEREGIFVLYNALGQVIQRKSLQASTLVPLGLAKGLYFYEVIFKEGKVHGKLQVE